MMDQQRVNEWQDKAQRTGAQANSAAPLPLTPGALQRSAAPVARSPLFHPVLRDGPSPKSCCCVSGETRLHARWLVACSVELSGLLCLPWVALIALRPGLGLIAWFRASTQLSSVFRHIVTYIGQQSDTRPDKRPRRPSSDVATREQLTKRHEEGPCTSDFVST